MNIVPYYQPQQGLNGRFGRWLKKAINVATQIVANAVELGVPIIGVLLGEQIRTLGLELENSIQAREAAPLAEPTAAEQALLDAWLEKYKVWIGNLSNEFAAAANKSTEAQKVAGINIVLNKIHTVLDHYEVYETAGLSANAIANRTSLIYESLKAINQSITFLLGTFSGTVTTVQATVNPASYNFSPLFGTTPLTVVSGDNYKVSGTRTNITGTLPIATPVATNVGGTKPTIITPVPTVNTPVSTNVPGIPATNPIKTVDPATTVPTTVAPEKKSMAGTLVILAAVGGIAYYAFKGGSKPKAAAKKTTTKKTIKK